MTDLPRHRLAPLLALSRRQLLSTGGLLAAALGLARLRGRPAVAAGQDPTTMVPSISLIDPADVTAGYRLAMTLGVDPNAISSDTAAPGGGQPPPGDPGGGPPPGGPAPAPAQVP